MCQSLSMGQGAFKANLLARHSQEAQSRISHLLWQGSGVKMAHLLHPPPPPGAGKYSVGGERNDQPIHPPPNATSPLKRGKGPGLQMVSRTYVSYGCPKGEGKENGSPSGHPLAFSPKPREEHTATFLTWAGWWEWPFPWPTCSPGAPEAPPLSLLHLFPGLRLAQV